MSWDNPLVAGIFSERIGLMGSSNRARDPQKRNLEEAAAKPPLLQDFSLFAVKARGILSRRRREKGTGPVFPEPDLAPTKRKYAPEKLSSHGGAESGV